MRKFLLILQVFLIVSLTSCGTMLRGGPETVPVDSEPGGAAIWLDGHNRGYTPKTLTVPHSAKGRIVLKLPGYKDHAQKLPAQFNPWTGLNLLWGWGMIVGFGIDAATGSMTTWDEAGIHVALEPASSLAGR